eukprot:403335522
MIQHNFTLGYLNNPNFQGSDQGQFSKFQTSNAEITQKSIPLEQYRENHLNNRELQKQKKPNFKLGCDSQQKMENQKIVKDLKRTYLTLGNFQSEKQSTARSSFQVIDNQDQLKINKEQAQNQIQYIRKKQSSYVPLLDTLITDSVKKAKREQYLKRTSLDLKTERMKELSQVTTYRLECTPKIISGQASLSVNKNASSIFVKNPQNLIQANSESQSQYKSVTPRMSSLIDSRKVTLLNTKHNFLLEQPYKLNIDQTSPDKGQTGINSENLGIDRFQPNSTSQQNHIWIQPKLPK